MRDRICTYMPWGSLVCNNSSTEYFTQEEEDARVARYEEGQESKDIVHLLDPSFTPTSPFVILFVERPKIDHPELSLSLSQTQAADPKLAPPHFPPYYGSWVLIPKGYHKDLGSWNEKTHAVYVPKGTSVTMYDKTNGDGYIGSYKVGMTDVPMLVNMANDRRGLSSLIVELAR